MYRVVGWKMKKRVWNTYVVVYIYFKKWKSLYWVSLRWNRQCVRVLVVKKEHDFRESYFFRFLVVRGCVVAFDLYNCIIWNNRVFFAGRCGLRGLYGWFIYFFYIVVCINVYVFYVDAGLRFEREPWYLTIFLYCLSSQTRYCRRRRRACSLSRDSIYR
jgi:hypothetical protein